jgi:hypothetical protein
MDPVLKLRLIELKESLLKKKELNREHGCNTSWLKGRNSGLNEAIELIDQKLQEN